MEFKALAWLLLLLVIVPTGCATADHPPDYTSSDSPDLQPATSRDDSHGWGTSIQNAGGR